MNVRESSIMGVAAIIVSGRLDSNTSAVLEELLSDQARTRPALIVDLKEVPYASSAGLRVLLKAAKLAKAGKNRLALAGLAPQVKEVFDISGFTPIFQIFEDGSAAAEALS